MTGPQAVAPTARPNSTRPYLALPAVHHLPWRRMEALLRDATAWVALGYRQQSLRPMTLRAADS